MIHIGNMTLENMAEPDQLASNKVSYKSTVLIEITHLNPLEKK